MSTDIGNVSNNLRTAEGLSHLRTAGRADTRPPENSKTKKDSDTR